MDWFGVGIGILGAVGACLMIIVAGRVMQGRAHRAAVRYYTRRKEDDV